MAAIRFRAVVGEEHVIRPPVGVRLPQGEIEVTVQPRQEAPSGQAGALAPTRDWLLALAAEAEQAAPALPSDLAEHHDHYAHGKPLP
jgi:hypothetical protein